MNSILYYIALGILIPFIKAFNIPSPSEALFKPAEGARFRRNSSEAIFIPAEGTRAQRVRRWVGWGEHIEQCWFELRHITNCKFSYGNWIHYCDSKLLPKGITCEYCFENPDKCMVSNILAI